MKERKVVLYRGLYGFGFSFKDNGQSFVSTATVGKVEAGGAADLGGIRVGDQVIAINGQPVRSMTFLQASNAIRASSEVVELELLEPNYAFQPGTHNSVRARASSPGPLRSRHIHADSSENPCSKMDPGNRAPLAPSSTRTLTVVSQSTSTTTTTAVSNTVTSIITKPSSTPISSLPCTNSHPSRLSISVAKYPPHSTVLASVTTPPAQPIPKPRRTRNPLVSFNQPIDTDQTKQTPGAITEPISSKSCTVLQPGSPNDSPTSASPSAIFDGPKISSEDLSKHDVGDINNHSEVTLDSNAIPELETVQHLDSTAVNKTHRRQTFARVCTTYDEKDTTGDGGGVPTVRFVRKRAYASARQAGRFDQFAAFNLSPNDSWSSSHSSTPTTNVTRIMESSTSPCQLLPAVPQHQPPSNVHVVEPKITHLPRRRSSKTQSVRPVVSLRRSRNSEDHEHSVIATKGENPSAYFSPRTSDPDSLVHNDSTVEQCPPSVRDRLADAYTKTENPSIPDSAPAERSETMRKPLQPPSMTSNQAPIPEATLATASIGKLNKSFGRLCASFDSDPDDNRFDWWSRVGETYQHLDLEYQRLVRRQTRLQQRQRATDATEWGDDFAVGSNKENKSNGSVKSDRREPGVVLNRGPLARMSVSISSNATWSSPVSRRTDGSPVLSMGATQTGGGDSQLSTQSNAPRRHQLRNLCSGLRCHRSESNIHHDMSGAFRSRQSLCKILALDGSTNKSFSWKPYYMCIAGSEVRFIKASAAFYGGNRKTKSAKQLTGDVSSSATGNASITDMVDDQRSHDGSLNMSRSTLNGSDYQPTRINWGPVSTTCSTSILLPLPGLIWTREPVPPDFPHWRPLAPATGPSSTVASRKPSPVPDTMDPIYSGLSEPTTDSGALIPGTNDESALRATFQCYRFAHVGAGVELLFVFPDENTALASLNMCELSGGREATSQDVKMIPDSEGTERKSYDLLFVNRLHSKDSSSTAGSGTTKQALLAQQVQRHADNVSVKPDTVRLVTTASTAPWPPNIYKLTDRRQRRLDQQFPFHEGTVIRLADSPIPVQGRQAPKHHPAVDSQSLRSGSLTVSTSLADGETQSSEDKSTQRTTKSRNGAPFLRGIKQWLNRPGFPSGSISSSTDSQLVPSSPPAVTTSVKTRLSAVLGDPPDFSDFELPGPIFGAPLENQISSPDMPCVPVILQALVLGLETHGLHLAGLYRKPGRHRTIAQFVCVANLAPSNIDLLLKLDAWREPNALCGLVKQFLRRIPTGLFSSATWEPLASLVDNRFAENSSQLAYLLLSIRVKLRKLASEAFGISIGHTIPIAPNTSDICTPDTEHGQSPSVSSPVCISPEDNAPNEPPTPTTPQSTSPFVAGSATWRWATLCYLVRHIRDVVALQRLNEVSYQCIAICFGPVFFGESPNLTRLNGVLENLFRHWPWLIQDLPLVTIENIESAISHKPPKIVHDYTLTEAVEYLTHFETQFTGSASVPTTTVTIVRSQPSATQTVEADAGSSPSPRSSDDQLSTQPASPDASEECYNHVCQTVRTLLDRTSACVVDGTCKHANSQHETSYPSLHRATSSLSSTPREMRTSLSHTASGRRHRPRRRKTMDTTAVLALPNTSGRTELNPGNHIRVDSVRKTNENLNQRRMADGVILRPLVPDQTHHLSTMGTGNASLTTNSPTSHKQ